MNYSRVILYFASVTNIVTTNVTSFLSNENTKNIVMHYGSVTDIAKKLKVSRRMVYYIKNRKEDGKPIRTTKGKRILRELKKAQ